MTSTKMEEKYHAWGARPEGTGSKAMMPAITRGSNAFHSGMAALAKGMPDFGSVLLDERPA